MKRNKKIFRGVMAGAIALALASPFIASNIAKADTLNNGRVAWFTFDDGNLESKEGDVTATAVKQGLSDYKGDVVFGSNRTSEEGKSIKLGDYGLKLNKQDLGETYSVSLWMKPDGTLAENKSVLFLGYHNPEKWFAIAGKNGSADCKVWANDADHKYYKWETISTVTLSSSDWHHIVLTGDEDYMYAYFDGKQVAKRATDHPLAGENQDIYVGVTNWDPAFTGLADDIMVYDRMLTEGEIERIYTDMGPAQILSKEGISVADIKAPVGREAAIDVEIPEAAKEENPSIKYEVEDKTVATVDKDGVLHALKEGTTTLTVTVKLDKVEKTDSATITVVGMDESRIAHFTFDDSLTDVIGNVDATAIVKGLGAYSGEVKYAAGKDGKAVSLDGYGLKLNKANIGDEFTVSAWLKPNGTFVENQSVLFMGYHNPEKWLSVAGNSASANCKFWANGNGYAWTPIGTMDISADTWHNLVITGTNTTVTAYLDGMEIASGKTNTPLTGENQDIYLGITNWDLAFSGLVDDVELFDLALTNEEVQERAVKDLNAILQDKLEAEASMEAILGTNENAQNIKFDLTLPAIISNITAEWSSSNEAVITKDGTVTAPKADTEVTLTVALNSGKLHAEKTYTLTALALDRAALDELIAKAKAADTSNMSASSVERLQKAIEEAEAANSFGAVDEAYKRLAKALDALNYTDTYADPFIYIEEAVREVSIEAGKTAEVFTIPVEVLNSVSVEYVSEQPEVVTYVDGVVTGVSDGKAVVTAIVTANADGWVMEYSTAVEVKRAGGVVPDPVEPIDPVDPKPPVVDPVDPVTPSKPSSSDNSNSGSSKKKHSSSSSSSSTTVATANTASTTTINDEATALAAVPVRMISTEEKAVVKEYLGTAGVNVTSTDSVYTQLADGAIIFRDGSAYTADQVMILVPGTVVLNDGRVIAADGTCLATLAEGAKVLTMDMVFHTVHLAAQAPAVSEVVTAPMTTEEVAFVKETVGVQVVSTQTETTQSIIAENGAGISTELKVLTQKEASKTSVNWFAYVIAFVMAAATCGVVVYKRKRR